MTKLNEETVKDILDKINVVVKSIVHGYGLDFEIVEPKFSEAYIEATMTLKVNDRADAQEQERKEYFMKHCESIHLLPEHWDMEFTFPPLDSKCKIFGLDFHDKDNPILLKDLKDGLIYKTAPMFFLNSI